MFLKEAGNGVMTTCSVLKKKPTDNHIVIQLLVTYKYL